MNLYFIQRTDKGDWDQYVSYVVAAETEQSADVHQQSFHRGWEGHTIKLIGTANPTIKPGEIIIANYRAG